MLENIISLYHGTVSNQVPTAVNNTSNSGGVFWFTLGFIVLIGFLVYIVKNKK